jgi:hypothetical protein
MEEPFPNSQHRNSWLDEQANIKKENTSLKLGW